MSANIDLVRSIYADWERGDFSKAEWAHPDNEWVNAYRAGRGQRPGASALQRRGKMSGVEIGELPSKTAAVFHLRDGKVTRYVVDGDRDRALADLGLER